MKNDHFIDPFLNILPKLDLHGETSDMVEYLVLDFIRASRKEGKFKVQIIHGRHGGILKRRTHEVLEKCNLIERFYLYYANDGVTIVELIKNDKNL